MSEGTGKCAGGAGGRVRYRLTAGQRLKGKETVDRVYKTGQRRSHHPLSVHTVRREDQGAARVGISIGKRCGNAVVRNEVKRKIREAFRLLQHDLPPGRDYLVVVKPHAVMGMEGYQMRLRAILMQG